MGITEEDYESNARNANNNPVYSALPIVIGSFLSRKTNLFGPEHLYFIVYKRFNIVAFVRDLQNRSFTSLGSQGSTAGWVP